MATITRTEIIPHQFQGPYKGSYAISGITEDDLDSDLTDKINDSDISGDFIYGDLTSSTVSNVTLLGWGLTSASI